VLNRLNSLKLFLCGVLQDHLCHLFANGICRRLCMSALEYRHNRNICHSQALDIPHPKTIVNYSHRISIGCHLACTTRVTADGGKCPYVLFSTVQICWMRSGFWPRTKDDIFCSSSFHQHFMTNSTTFSEHSHIEIVVK
jgi:hypothetical protein